MGVRKLNMTWDISPLIDDPDAVVEAFYTVGCPHCATPESGRILDMDKNDYDRYLLYLASFLHDVETPADGEEKESPFSFEIWTMCGCPKTYIRGIKVEGNNYLELINEKGGIVGYINIDERMASYIAEGIASGRFKVSARRTEEKTGNENV